MRGRNQAGFSMVELLVVIAIIGIMALIVIPTWLAYGPAATITGAAREVQAGLYQARQLAISTRQNVCVQVVPPRGYQLRVGVAGGCAGGAAWTGPNTDGTGIFWLANQSVTLAAPPLNPVFTPFGTAAQVAAFTVTGPQARQQTVTVSPLGRVSIP